MIMDEKLLKIWLSEKSSVSPAKKAMLIDYFGSAKALYEAGCEAYKNIGELSKSAVISLCDKSLDVAKKIISDCSALGIRILTDEDEDFPETLSFLSSPVLVLYARGRIPHWEEILSVAVVGTRRASEYGRVVTERISGELAEAGVTIISGMAAGIDSYALQSALRVGGSVIAVMGCGLDTAYPVQNSRLMDEIVTEGCALSEYPPYTPPSKQNFPERNRIISGLSDGVLAVEAPSKSGALITANYARETGKPLFAVPGNIFAQMSKGTNNLIKSGANAVTCAQDILDAYPIRSKNLTPVQRKPKITEKDEIRNVTDTRIDGLSGNEKKVAMLLFEKDMHIEEICARSGLTIPELNAVLPLLEIEGIISKLPGSRYRYLAKEK